MISINIKLHKHNNYNYLCKYELSWFTFTLFFNILGSVYFIKGTVVAISSDPPVKEGHLRFTTIPFKLLSDQKCERYHRFNKILKSQNLFFLFHLGPQLTFIEKPQLKITIFIYIMDSHSFLIKQSF